MRKRIYRILPVLIGSIFLGGCSVEVQDNGNPSSGYYIYEISQDETQLVREAYSPEETTVEYMLKDMMQRLNNREADKEDIGLLPDEVQMNYSIEDNVLVVNFNSKYQEMSGTYGPCRRGKDIFTGSGDHSSKIYGRERRSSGFQGRTCGRDDRRYFRGIQRKRTGCIL